MTIKMIQKHEMKAFIEYTKSKCQVPNPYVMEQVRSFRVHQELVRLSRPRLTAEEINARVKASCVTATIDTEMEIAERIRPRPKGNPEIAEWDYK